MWRNWNIGLPVNQVPSDDESNYESPVDEDPSNLVSPNRPHQSPSASPRALLRPDPPPVEEVLQGVQQQLARDVRMAFEDEDGREQRMVFDLMSMRPAPSVMIVPSSSHYN